MSFDLSLVDGCYGERVIFDYLNKCKSVRQVIDVRDDIYFREKDVDFLVEDTNRQFTWVEVKTDFKAQDTGNIVYELTTSGNIGCFEKTQAKYIYYYLPVVSIAYVINMERLRRYIQCVKPPLKRMGDNAEGYLLNIQQLLENKAMQEIKNVR